MRWFHINVIFAILCIVIVALALPIFENGKGSEGIAEEEEGEEEEEEEEEDDPNVGNGGTRGENNSAPSVELMFPENGKNTTNPVQLFWQGSDNESDDLTFDLYIGTDPNASTLVVNDTIEESYETYNLTRNVTYYWKVIAWDGTNENVSEIFQFTLINSLPLIDLYYPDNYDRLNEYYTTLVWMSYDADEDFLLFDVYLDKNDNPTTLVDTTFNNTYFPDALDKYSAYYWKIVAYDGWSEVESEVFKITITSWATPVDMQNDRYIIYQESNEPLDVGGFAMPFRMYRNNTLSVSINIDPPGKVDFYLVRGPELRRWMWAPSFYVLDSIPLGTSENARSISYFFTAPEDGVYCVIIDDSEMGLAPPADDPETYQTEQYTYSFNIKLHNPVPNIPYDDTDGEYEPESDSEMSWIGGVVSLVCGIGMLAILVYVVKDTFFNKAKKNQQAYLGQPPMAGRLPPPNYVQQQMSGQGLLSADQAHGPGGAIKDDLSQYLKDTLEGSDDVEPYAPGPMEDQYVSRKSDEDDPFS